MPSHSEGPGIWLSVWRFLLTHCLYERAAEVLARLRGCEGLPEPSLFAQDISTKFAWHGPFNLYLWKRLSYNMKEILFKVIKFGITLKNEVLIMFCMLRIFIRCLQHAKLFKVLQVWIKATVLQIVNTIHELWQMPLYWSHSEKALRIVELPLNMMMTLQ